MKVQSGGGGNRTLSSLDATSLDGNDLEKCPLCLTALWLHSQVTDSRELSQIGVLLKTWPSLPQKTKQDIEALLTAP